MDIITGVDDTNLEICYNLDYLSILNLKESCQYFYKILQNNGFWKNYIYNELKKHQIDTPTLEKYRPQFEPYMLSYRTYYTTNSIQQAIKEKRTDSIVILKVFGSIPCMWDAQLACEFGNVVALEYFYDEYSLLPNASELADEPKKLPYKPKRKKDKMMYLNFRGIVGVGMRGPVGPRGATGLRGPVGPQGATGPPGYINGPPDPYAIRIAIKNDNDHVLEWLYRKNIKPTQTSVTLFGYSDEKYDKKTFQWLYYMNQKDHMGLVIN
ncbi:collagen triple helix repeat motif-containing protein [Klosneuvirus KNV1]|uniref:Collagen triple helix repeat motif-containing protein n=1 Tax=Klosneuvirus KNV1 TaxID=1977640 RepID=A0A1V0SJU4_9VIRU|nr:collagen triple helix repeat motif-containing protein [Klosneuvirus KNV1]